MPVVQMPVAPINMVKLNAVHPNAAHLTANQRLANQRLVNQRLVNQGVAAEREVARKYVARQVPWPRAVRCTKMSGPLPRISIAPHTHCPAFLSPHISLALYGRLQPWAFIRVRTCLTLELPVLGTFPIGKCPYSEMSVSGPVLPASEFFTHNDWSTIIDPKLLTRVWCPTVQGPKLVAQTFQPDHGDPMTVSCVRFMTTS